MATILGDFDLEQVWRASEYAEKAYVGAPCTDEQGAALERELAYTLAASYVEFMRYHNGGIPKKTCQRTPERTSWANEHICIHGMFSIGRAKPSSVCGSFGSHFWRDEWGYPAIGISCADGRSAGHDMVGLDYREGGLSGEPRVVHVDQEWDDTITCVAESVEAFIRGLESEEALEQEA